LLYFVRVFSRPSPTVTRKLSVSLCTVTPLHGRISNRPRMIARDSKAVMDDTNAFGQEVAGPRHWANLLPLRFVSRSIPSRLCASSSHEGSSAVASWSRPRSVSLLRKTCERTGAKTRDDCVFDVLTSGDLEMAMVECLLVTSRRRLAGPFASGHFMFTF
jgi:hypothetical protein